MRNALVWLPAAFVLGGLVGSIGPLEKLDALKESRAREMREIRKSKANGFGAFAEMVKIPETASRSRRGERRGGAATNGTVPAAADARTASATNRLETAEAARKDAASRPSRPFDPKDLRERIAEAEDLWRTRVDLAKAAAVERLGLDENGAARFEAALASMNESLRESLQDIADRLARAEKMTPELGVRLMGDLATTVAETYDAIGTCVPEDRRGEVAEMMFFDFVDPSVAEPLVSVQDKLDGADVFRGGARP